MVEGDPPPLVSAIVQAYHSHEGGASWQPEQLVQRLHAVPLSIEILVNDDSMDDTASPAWRQWLTGPHDFYLQSNNIHEIRAYNRLARFARGTFLVFLQGDYCLPTSPAWLLQAVHLFNAFPELSLLGGASGYRSSMTDESRGATKTAAQEYTRRKRAGMWGASPYRPIASGYQANGTVVPFAWIHAVSLGPLIVRRTSFSQVGGFDEALSSRGNPGIGLDESLSLQMWRAGLRVGIFYSGVINGIGGRKSMRPGRAHANRRSASVRNAARLAPWWVELNESITLHVDTANALLVPFAETEQREQQQKAARASGANKRCRSDLSGRRTNAANAGSAARGRDG